MRVVSNELSSCLESWLVMEDDRLASIKEARLTARLEEEQEKNCKRWIDFMNGVEPKDWFLRQDRLSEPFLLVPRPGTESSKAPREEQMKNGSLGASYHHRFTEHLNR